MFLNTIKKLTSRNKNRVLKVLEKSVSKLFTPLTPRLKFQKYFNHVSAQF